MSSLSKTALAALMLVAACGPDAPDTAPASPGDAAPEEATLGADELLSFNPPVLLTCDARTATLTAELVDNSAQYDAVKADMAEDDPLIVRVLDEDTYALYNTRVMRAEAAEDTALPEPDRDLIAIVKRPTRVFCVAEGSDFFASGDMAVERSPGNINPMGRCGAAEIVTLTIRRNADEPVVVDLIGDCHFAEERVTKVTLDLATGALATEREPAFDALLEEE